MPNKKIRPPEDEFIHDLANIATALNLYLSDDDLVSRLTKEQIETIQNLLQRLQNKITSKGSSRR